MFGKSVPKVGITWLRSERRENGRASHGKVQERASGVNEWRGEKCETKMRGNLGAKSCMACRACRRLCVIKVPDI